MACNFVIKNNKVESATTNSGKPSVLFPQLKNINDNNDELARNLYAVTETKEFKDWFKGSTSVNNVGEPELRGEFYTNKEGETWWAKATNKKDGTDKFPFGLNRVAGLTAAQVNDIANFTYAYIMNNVENLESINYKQEVLNVIAGLNNEYLKIGDTNRLAIISILQEDLNFIGKKEIDKNSKFLKLIENRLKQDGFVETEVAEEEVSEQDATSPINIKTKYLMSPKGKASVTFKLMLRSTMSDTLKNKTLGTPEIINYNDVYNLLLRELAGELPSEENMDVYDIYIEKLRKLETQYPYLNNIINRLEKSPDHIKTQFVNTLALEKIIYTQTLYSGSKGNRQYKIGKPNSQTQSELIRDEWTEAFKSKIFKYNTNANLILNDDIDLSKIKDKYKRVMENINNVINNKPKQHTIVKQVTDLFNMIGIEVNPKVLTSDFSNLPELLKFLAPSQGGMGYVFTTEIPKIITAYTVRDKKRKDVIKIKDIDLPIKNEKSVLKLAELESKYRIELLDNSVLGPEGSMYWGFNDYSWMSQVLDTIEKDPSYLNKLASIPYNANSEWIQHLQNEGTISRSIFMQMKKDSKYTGLKYFNLQEADQLADRISRVANGEHILMTPGNSRTLYTLKLFEKNGNAVYNSSDVNITYNKEKNSYDFEYLNGNENKLIERFKGYILDEFGAMDTAYQHVFEGKLPKDKQILYYHYDETGNERDTNGVPTGNAFKHTLFPELSYGGSESKGFYYTAGEKRGKPIYDKEMLSNEKIVNLIKRQFEKYAIEQINIAVENELITKDLTKNQQLAANILSKSHFNNLGDLLIGRVMADYVYSSIVANVESTKLFLGDIRYYKSLEDFPKRSNLYTTAVTHMRFIKNQVNPLYLHATVNDIIAPSKYLQDREGYDKINISDATTWITPELQKQRMKGFGQWTPEVEEAYEKLMAGELQTSDILKLTPRKGTARGTEFKNGMHVPYREKTAEVVLWPGLINDSSLKKLYDEMQRQEKDWKEINGSDIGMSVSVESAIKVGAGLRSKIDNDAGDITDEITLNPIERSHLLYGKQQEIPTKGIKPTTFGSQLKINILADIDPDAMIGNMTGAEWRQAVEDLEIDISNLGKKEFFNRYGIDKDLNINEDKLRAELVKQLSSQEFVDNTLVEGLQNGLKFDSIFQSRRKLLNLLAKELTNSTVTYKTIGANKVQITSFGLGKVEGTQDLSEETRSKIRYLTSDELKPPRIENNKVILGDIFIPYSYIESIPGHEAMSDKELKEKIGKNVLTVVGYRIPNQSLASTDVLNIAGILPKEAGDTAVVYSEVTAKTGSDFDIDKLFMLIPNVEYNKKSGKLELIEGDSKKALENERILLYKQLFETREQYPRVIKSIDTQKLKTDAKDLIKLADEQDKFDGLKMFTGQFQQELKTRFSAGAAGVGAVANNTIDNVLGQMSNLDVPDIGLGKRIKIGNETRTVLNSLNRIDGDLISEILSGYMNAFVDIEKDPYITNINFVKPVMNVAFLLLRSGVDPKWVNSFIKQPIIREYVKRTFKGKSQILNNRPISEQRILNGMGSRGIEINEVESTLTLKNLRRGIDNKILDNTYQDAVLSYFKILHPIGQALFEQNLASKVHTTGTGQDLLDSYLTLARIQNVIDKGIVQNFEGKFDNNRMMGAYLNNGPSLFLDLFSKKFLFKHLEGVNMIVESLLGDFNKFDYRTRRQIEDSMYSYMYSSHKFSSSLESLLFDTAKSKSLIPRFLKMKQNNPDSILLNVLLKHKKGSNIDGVYKQPSQIYLANSKNMPQDVIEGAKAEWENFLNSKDKNERQFFNDLASYAYHTSGFKNGLKTFYNLIPTTWNQENGFNKTVQELEDSYPNQIAMGLEQLIQHEYTNQKLAPRVFFKQITKIS
ncbi:MAG: hypothetical protein CMG00_05915, partial [Candidatus Marinimicrobia bacterium]|nr:hypothetical protein [Candidatus Neomarinimicrobiota bacterium]